jgi:two-component system chemotaxis response regulator CheB
MLRGQVILKVDGSFQPWDVIAIGASGSQGYQDILNLLRDVPPEGAAVFLVTLHRPADRQSHLRSLLARATSLPVRVALDGEVLAKGVCYLGQPDKHLTLGPDNRARMIASSGNEYRNRTIDTLFLSVARYAKEHAIGVVLAGGLSDGCNGLEAIKQAGGLAMARTPHLGWDGDMPRNAIRRAGPLDLVAPVHELAWRISRGTTRWLPAPINDSGGEPIVVVRPEHAQSMKPGADAVAGTSEASSSFANG